MPPSGYHANRDAPLERRGNSGIKENRRSTHSLGCARWLVCIPAPIFPSRMVGMDLEKVIAELREERELIDRAISSLTRLARSRGKRRGRPPSWLAAPNKQASTAKRKRTAKGDSSTRP